MESIPKQSQLVQSCEILFGSDLNISREFLEYLQPSGLKTAYRKRAMETHPDRLIRQNQAAVQRNDAFHAVQEAYENLLVFLKAKGRMPQAAVMSGPASPHETSAHPKTRTSSGYRQRTAHRSARDTGAQQPLRQTIKPIILAGDTFKGAVYANTESLYQGELPPRPLLFGHFLYYSGLSNWRTIARILIWQRMGRPRLGELGHRFGMFNSEDIASILQNKTPSQRFGQTATRLGMLTEHQLQILITQQLRLQKKFGTILLEKNLLQRHELQELLNRFTRHNATTNVQKAAGHEEHPRHRR